MRYTKHVSVKEELGEQHEVDMQLVLKSYPFLGSESAAFLYAIHKLAEGERAK